MSNEFKKVSSTEADLTILLKWDDVEKKYEDELKKIQLKATLPGFRQGKAPRALVEKKLGDGFLQEIASDAMNEALEVAIKELDEKEKPISYSTPVLQEEDKVFPVKKGEDISFTVRYEIMPEFDIEKYKGYTIEYPNVKISDEMVEKEISHLQEQNAIVKDKGDAPIAEGDVVTVNYEAADVKDSKREGYTFTVGDHTSFFDFDDDIIGWKKGDKKTIEKTYKEGERPIGFSGEKASITIEILNVKSRELPAIDDEFAEDVNEEYKTVADLKKGVRARLEDRLNDSLEETKIDALIDTIKPSINLAIPECMVDMEVASTLRRFGAQFGMNDEETVKFLKANGQSVEDFTAPWRDDARKTIEGQLIITKVRDKENLNATDEEIQEELKKEFPDEKDKETREMYKGIIADTLAYQKAIKFLLAENTFTPSKEEISYEDFASGAYLQKDEKKDDDKKSEDN